MYSFHDWDVTLYIYFGGGGGDSRSVTGGLCPALTMLNALQTVLQIFCPVVHQKSHILGFYYSTDKISRIMFIVSVIHC